MFYDVYSNLCNAKGKSMSAVALELGIPKASVTTWKKDGYTPRADTIQKIAEYFNVSTDYLLENDNKKTSLSSKHDKLVSEILIKFPKLSEEQQGIVMQMIDQLVKDKD